MKLPLVPASFPFYASFAVFGAAAQQTINDPEQWAWFLPLPVINCVLAGMHHYQVERASEEKTSTGQAEE